MNDPPSTICFIFGTTRRDKLEDLSCLGELKKVYKAELYLGEVLCKQLNTSNKILNTVRNFTGNQWRDCKMGVMWLDLFEKVTRRAAVFSNLCKRESWVCGKRYMRELQKSNREEMRARTIFSVAERVRC